MNLAARSRVAITTAMLLAAHAANVAAQAGVIRGLVVRADQPVGLAEADVLLNPSGVRTRTNSRGFFEFQGVPPGRVELSVHRVGFAPTIVVVQVDGVMATKVDISLEPVAAILDPIVSSVTRDQRSLSEVAAAVSVADSSAIDRGRTVGLNETMRMMPGVQAASQYGTDQVSIGIRGSAARGAFALRGIAVLLDGIPLTESDGRSRLDLIELAATRQVEVARGPASALYAASPGGVVNVVSRSGRDSRGISARALRGAFGFQKYDGRAGGVFAGGRGSGFAAASYTSADGYRDHSDGSNSRGQVAFDFVATPATRVAIEANGSRLDLRLPGTLSQPELDADPDAAAATAIASDFRREDSRYRTGIRLEHAFGAGTATGYFFYGGRTLYLQNPVGILDATFHRPQVGARFRWDGVAHSTIGATVGFDYDNLFGPNQFWENAERVRGALLDDAYLSVPNLGVYTQAMWQVAPTIGATLGLRYDRVIYRFESYSAGAIPRQEKSFEYLSPRMSALWSVDPATSLYASVGRGSEVPIIGELAPSSFAPLSPVRPKSLWNYEVGVRRVIQDRVLLEATVFYATVRGEFVPITREGVTIPENASRSRDVGVELGVTARPSPRVELGAGYTFLDLRLLDYSSEILDSLGKLERVDFSGKLLPAVPRHRATADARFHPLDGVELGVQVEWQSSVYVETGNTKAGTWYYYPPQPGAGLQQVAFRAIPARGLVHLSGALHLGPATLFANVENLFGLRYAGTVEPNEGFGRFYEAGSPASVSVGLSVAGLGAATGGSLR